MRDFTVQSDNNYGTCVAVSMDGKPLRESKKVLIQCGTNTLPAGWQQSAAPADGAAPEKKKGSENSDSLMKIESIGHAPWMMERVRMTATLSNVVLTKATALDANGYSTGNVEIKRTDGKLTLTLPEDALHVVLE